LLERIQKDPNLGYTIEVSNSYNNSLNYSTKTSWKQAVVAFADDTTWIASSREQMEQTLQIAEDFFELNDIQINGKKSKLIITNPSEPKENRKIKLSNEWIYEEEKTKITRFLGIWLNSKLNENQIKSRAKELVRSTTRLLNTKKMTGTQVSYINNMCIVPKLTYMLQTTKLSKRIIEAIQSPIIGLAKHKLGIARTVSNSIIIHRNMGNCNALWNQLVTKQITGLHARLNSTGPEEILTKIRVNQGLLLVGATEESWHKIAPKVCSNLWKNNLACQTMLKAKDLQMSFYFDNINIEEKNEELRIAEVLENKLTLQAALALRRLNLTSINQLINRTGDKMISWHQLKVLRKESSKGRTASWFKKIEETILEDKNNRQLKPEYILSNKNRKALQTPLDSCSRDNRKREWIVLKSSKGKETNNLSIRKVVINTPKKVLTEHWEVRTVENKISQVLKKCEGCSLDHIGELKSCKKWSYREEVQGSLSRFIRKGEDPQLIIDKEMIYSQQQESKTKIDKSEAQLEDIICYDLDIELIKKQRLSKEIKELLISKNQKNQLNTDNELIFYTDGSLKKAATNNASDFDHMGAGWIQVDTEEEKVIDEGAIGA
jgi:hypothetical protein